jgi:hypothetical protein
MSDCQTVLGLAALAVVCLLLIGTLGGFIDWRS